MMVVSSVPRIFLKVLSARCLHRAILFGERVFQCDFAAMRSRRDCSCASAASRPA